MEVLTTILEERLRPEEVAVFGLALCREMRLPRLACQDRVGSPPTSEVISDTDNGRTRRRFWGTVNGPVCESYGLTRCILASGRAVVGQVSSAPISFVERTGLRNSEKASPALSVESLYWALASLLRLCIHEDWPLAGLTSTC